jgi:hypothetical protein
VRVPIRFMLFALAVGAPLALPTTARAQGGFGVKGGVSFADLSSSGVLPGDLGRRTGFAAGVTLGSRAGGLEILLEALYAQRGVESGLSSSTAERKTDYLDVPLLVGFTLSTGGLSPFAYAGPQISFELRCKVGDVDCPDETRETTDYAAVLGAGLQFGAAGGFTVEGRYIYGLRNLNFNEAIETIGDETKTRSFLVLAGFAF